MLEMYKLGIFLGVQPDSAIRLQVVKAIVEVKAILRRKLVGLLNQIHQ